MALWEGERKDIENLCRTVRGHLPDIVKELEQLIKTDDPNVVMLYSRRCLEVIITDLCERELQRPRKTEPLKGIIDKLNAEEKVPSHIITSMLSLNSMANYGAHPKDFDPDQVKPVLNNLAIIIKWYIKYKDFKVVGKTGREETEKRVAEKQESRPAQKKTAGKKNRLRLLLKISPFILLLLAVVIVVIIRGRLNVPSYVPPLDEKETFTDVVNNEIYSVVRIGNQVWMGENLRSEKFNDGTPIPMVTETEEWASLTTPGFCWYDNDRSLYKPSPYGALYNWHAVNTGKLCPSGWRVPSAAEWDSLIWFAGDSIPAGLGYLPVEKETAAIKLKEAGNIHWLTNDTIHSTDEFGFTALPGGLRNVYGHFFSIEERGYWWTSTEVVRRRDRDSLDANTREMYWDRNGVVDIHQYKKFGLSVRCVKDK